MLLTVIRTGVTFYFYGDATCTNRTSLSHYALDTCNEPWQDFPSMTTDINSLMESTYRTLSCSTEVPAYFTKYYYAGEDCDAAQLISAEAITTNDCVKADDDGHYLMFLCGKPA